MPQSRAQTQNKAKNLPKPLKFKKKRPTKMTEQAMKQKELQNQLSWQRPTEKEGKHHAKNANSGIIILPSGSQTKRSYAGTNELLV
ncbi:hypothetical protein PoB_004292300 [Plakobranchus ocellatus]|uniref:Uncharacterized protein n=1 Tax=Plakobranchus ocellatus TaxID=259542 RepID=A0AAV4BA01_9GAST|nr:hypothetical protein PoB_004292300 [Plakobranchus ocellatus]